MPAAPRRRAVTKHVASTPPAAPASTTETLSTLLAGSGPALRREDGREVPLGPRGAATRNGLMLAARAVFEEQGYGQSSVAQISERAGVSQGTFYQYFRDRAHVMTALVDDFVVALLTDERLAWHLDDGRVGLRRPIIAFVSHYAESAEFSRVWEEVSQIDPGLADVRRRLTRVIEQGLAGELGRGVEAGVIPALGDPVLVARALTAMTDRFCFLTYAFDPIGEPPSADSAADMLTEMWANAIGLEK